MMTYTAPGVYVKDVSTLPPSVVAVATAIPAFIGYTEKALNTDQTVAYEEDDDIVVRRISTMLEYEQYFGANPKFVEFELKQNGDRYEFVRLKAKPEDLLHSHLMYYALQLYFANGGGSCYIVSVGRYKSTPEQENIDKDQIKKGIEKLAEYDEPTLILMPDAINLAKEDYHSRCEDVLAQCNLLKDRFGIFDVRRANKDETVEELASQFRDGINNEYLDKGAAYTPYLKTALTYGYREVDVEIGGAFWQYQSDNAGKNGIRILYPDLSTKYKKPEVLLQPGIDDLSIEVSEHFLSIKNIDNQTAQKVLTEWNETEEEGNFKIHKLDNGDLSPEELALDVEVREYYTNPNGVRITYPNNDGISPKIQIVEGGAIGIDIDDTTNPNEPTIKVTVTADGSKVADVMKAWDDLAEKKKFNMLKVGDGKTALRKTTLTSIEKIVVQKLDRGNKLLFIYSKSLGELRIPKVELANASTEIEFKVEDTDNSKKIVIKANGKTNKEIIKAWKKYNGQKGQFQIEEDKNMDEVSIPTDANMALTRSNESLKLNKIEESFTQLYNDLKTSLAQQRVILPPSSAIAGVYARVDRDRGVWKSPANVGLSSVIEPIRKINNEQHGRLNVDPTSGKSINAILAKTGKGILVMGGRTLLGNSNEWRFVSVRRLFIFIQESIQKATEFAVFEPNTATTWLKVKGLIESFLYGLWQQGALAGPTPESAYQVSVGLGKTMTPQDVKEGKMIVEVRIAAAIPAEVIVLKFMHKMQEA